MEELLRRNHDDFYLKILQRGATNKGYYLIITELSDQMLCIIVSGSGVVAGIVLEGLGKFKFLSLIEWRYYRYWLLPSRTVAIFLYYFRLLT
jgi:hypothetical protein